MNITHTIIAEVISVAHKRHPKTKYILFYCNTEDAAAIEGELILLGYHDFKCDIENTYATFTVNPKNRSESLV